MNEDSSEKDGCKPTVPRNLSSLLAGFDKSRLKKTDTTVTTFDGLVVVEGRDNLGHTVIKSVTTGNLGYVGSVQEDLQVGEILPGLILGSQDVAHSEDLLMTYKVTHILNCASYVRNLHPDLFTYKDIELRDLPETRIIDRFPEALEFIKEGIKAGCVLVHCNAGVSRSATLVIAYLMKHEGMTYEESFKYLRHKREKVCPNPGFVAQLKHYESTLRARSSST